MKRTFCSISDRECMSRLSQLLAGAEVLTTMHLNRTLSVFTIRLTLFLVRNLKFSMQETIKSMLRDGTIKSTSGASM
jgi:hypothetical protein